MDRRRFLENPYRPGAGHLPPYLAGRVDELQFFKRAIRQSFVSENILITGLRGFGKTVLVEHMRQMVLEEDWLWVGNDLSESSSLTEDRLALRILLDLSEALTQRIGGNELTAFGESVGAGLETYDALHSLYERSPGLPSDRLKAVFLRVGTFVQRCRLKGIILAYDEAQCLADHAERNEFPMSLLIETVATLQKREGTVPLLLILSGLPNVLDELTNTRTYTERMFHVMTLDRLSRQDTLTAVAKPLEDLMPPLRITPELVDKVVDLTGGYPYLIQFFGKELIDATLQNGGVLHADSFPSDEVFERLDSGLFAARWSKTTDKQREFLRVLANRGPAHPIDFSAQDAATLSQGEWTNAQANQMMQTLSERGILYRTRHGRYTFTVPMSEAMILRRLRNHVSVDDSWQPRPAVVDPVPPTERRRKGWSLFG
jgi:hypothetical protein